MCKHNTTTLNARLAGGEGSSAGDEDRTGHEGGAWNGSENKTMTLILAGSPTMGPSSPAKSNDDSGLLDSPSSCLKPKEGSSSISTVKMQDGQSFEVGEVRLEGTFTSSSPGRTLYMYSATTTPGEPGVTLQLRDPDEDADVEEKNGSLTSVLARIQGENGASSGGTLAISYGAGITSDPDIESSIDVLLGSNTISSSSGQPNSNGFSGIFAGEGGGDLALSPLAATSDSFLNDNSPSPQLSNTDIDTESNEEEKCGGDSNKLCVKKPRSKASSPNRQGPQQCQTCGKIFGNASALAKHKLTHSDERKYVCTMCGKAFKRQDHLNGHMLTHRNKKPYECRAEGCGKSYCDARSLRRHTENHHSGLQLPNSSAPSPSSSSMNAGGIVGLASGGREDDHGGGTSPNSANGCIQFAPATQLASSSMTNSASSALSPDSTASTTSVAVPSVAATTASTSAVAKTHTISHLQQLLASEPSNTSLVPTGSTVSSCLSKIQPSSTKPVECNLCHRKFKNIPALNGHMRLHGGYFKKDSDSKKCEKKEVTGPPLQTASVSVRALIEEKIIQKRTNPALCGQSLPTQHNISHVSVSTGGAQPENVSTKHVDLASTFTALTVGSSDVTLPISSSTAQPSVDHPLFKRSPNKMVVKRASSDPGLLLPSVPNSMTTQLHLTLPPKSNSLMDEGYLSPPLPEDVLEQVESVRESMLLQGVDPNQLADSIQAATLQEIASLEEYQSPSPSPQSIQPHQDIQSVLDSPLPVGLADFAYSHSQRNDNDSPLPAGQPYSSSPLPSPSFTYPTPPASQEGHSPSIAPLQSVISNGPVASPLSAAFYTSPMSSSAAVEAALNEVLPPNNYPSSPPTSPLSDSPVPSPLSLPPESTSPLPHHVFQSQMMPNSDDPLLSSSPRDFCPRKRFDFQALKLLTSGTLDFGNAGAQGVTGIVLDRNGELKLIQTSCIQSMKPCSINTNCNNNNPSLFLTSKSKSEGNICSEINPKLSTSPLKMPLTLKQMMNGHGQSLDSLKEELEDVFFLSPSVPASPVRTKKRLKLENPMTNNSFVSRLRKPREKLPNEDKNLLYTPPPMLPPMRHGRGLYWHTVTSWPNSSTGRGCHSDDKSLDSNYVEPAIESDSLAHINIGEDYQVANIPPCNSEDLDNYSNGSVHERLLWNSSIIKNSVDDKKLTMYLEFACCGAVPGGGRNKEYALHILQMCGGNIRDAMLRLIQPTPTLQEDHPLLTFDYPDSERWTSCEIEAFQIAIMKFEKDFSSIAQEIGSKTRKQCVQFYYIWKKLCPEDYKRLRSVNEADMVSSSPESRLFVCEHQDCSASFNSRAALMGHTRLHLNSTSTRCGTPDRRNNHASQLPASETLEEFPCKICGKIFNKVKSRSAHMKSHRPPDGEPRKMRDSTIKIDTIESSPTNRNSPATISHRGN